MTEPQTQNAGIAGDKPPLWTRNFIMVTFANFFLFCGFGMLPSLLPLHFRDLGAPEAVIGFVAGVYTVACVIMRPLVGVAIDRWGRKGARASMRRLIASNSSPACTRFVEKCNRAHYRHGRKARHGI